MDTLESKTGDSNLLVNNISFVFQTPENEMIQDEVILNQAFKLISKRLTVDDYICY
ncbi:hypothetical protein [Psychroserpens mesophilus]|uniref:hypothetical protein n=1 Tax=Psychroserpens mesophilus TaxID=325473 RepID=UPI003D653008